MISNVATLFFELRQEGKLRVFTNWMGSVYVLFQRPVIHIGRRLQTSARMEQVPS